MTLLNTPEITVNGTQISAAMIDAEIQYHPSASRREAMVKAAETLIIYELVMQKAIAKGIATEKDKGFSDQQAALTDQLIQSELSVPEATAEECERYYSANVDTFKSSPLVEVDHILIASDPQDLEHRAESLKLAEQLINLIVSKEASLAQLAKRYSACPSKEVGGSLGQITQGQTVSEFERQVFAAPEGLMMQPVESRYGYHVVFVARKVAGQVLPYEMVKEKIERYLNDKVQRKAVSQYLHRLVSEADIKGFAFDFDQSMLMQ